MGMERFGGVGAVSEGRWAWRGQAGDSRGEALAWRWVMEAKLRLGKFKDALGAAEAAMVIAAGS